MIIKLNFTDALQISPMIEQDRLVFHVKNLSHNFISETYLIDLNANYTTLSRPIRKQMIDNSVSRNLISGSEDLKTTFFGSALVSMVLNMFFGGAISRLFSLIRAFQLVLHFPILKILLPSNIVTLNGILIPIVMFDILENVDFL